MPTSTPTYEVIYAPFAELQIDAALLWWRENRPAASDLLAREIAEALDLLARAPRAGRRARLRGHTAARRLLLRRSEYQVYYTVDESAKRLHVVYLRHARRRPLRAR